MSVPASELGDAVAGILGDIVACSRQVLEQPKRLLNVDARMRIDDLADLSAELFGGDEARSRMRAALAR